MLKTADICIIGGGPAGSVLGARLAQFGFSACLIERVAFPRHHLGESLSPGVVPMLESIGAGPAIEKAAFPRARKVSVLWEEDEERQREDPEGQGMLVDRGHFDRLLLEHARSCGVHILQPATVEKLQRCEHGWSVAVAEQGQVTELTVRFVADASGRGGFLEPRHRRRNGPQTLALHAYWKGPDLPLHPRIEAGANEWFWGVPLPDGLYNTIVFLDPRDLRAMPGTLDEKFHHLIASSSLLPRETSAKLVGEIQATDATPYLDEECVTADSIKVGDAALALDPLSSSGVQKAIQSALSGSVVVNTLLKQPRQEALARQFYRESLSDASTQHQTWARGHYGQVAANRTTRFWNERAADADVSSTPAIDASRPEAALPADLPLRLSPEVKIVEKPCIVDRFIAQRPTVCSPSLSSPVAYLGGFELTPLLCRVREGMTLTGIAQSWIPHVTLEKGLAIARWLVSRGVLIPHSNEPATVKRRGA